MKIPFAGSGKRPLAPGSHGAWAETGSPMCLPGFAVSGCGVGMLGAGGSSGTMSDAALDVMGRGVQGSTGTSLRITNSLTSTAGRPARGVRQPRGRHRNPGHG